MKTKTNGKKEMGKMILGAFLAVTACTLLFNGLTERVMASELGKTEVVPTSYNVTPLAAKKNEAPKGYQKADYRVVADPLPYYQDKKPTSKDVTMERAAELGAQALWEIWSVDLTGATFYMGYDPASENNPRPTWSADVRFGERKKPDGTPGLVGYYVSLDAVTGELATVSLSRTLSETVPLGLDAALAKNPGVYTGLARDLAEKHGFVQGKVQTAEYNGQGYEGNDPSITIYVTGEGGDTAALTFSRYDKQFTGLIYPEALRISDAVMEKYVAEIEKQAGQQRQTASTDESPALTALT